MKDFPYDGSYEQRAEALARMDAGDRLVCSRCSAPLTVSTAAIVCTRNENHVSVHTLRRARGEVIALTETASAPARAA